MPNGRSLHLPSNITFVYETDSLAQASPSFIASCGIISMQPTVLLWQQLVQQWLDSLPAGTNAAASSHVWDVLQLLMPAVIDMLLNQVQHSFIRTIAYHRCF